GPYLEPKWVLLKERPCALKITREALYLHLALQIVGEALLKPCLNDADRDGGYVDSNPLAAQLVGSRHGRSAPTEGVKDNIAGIARSVNDALKQCERLLCRIA